MAFICRLLRILFGVSGTNEGTPTLKDGGKTRATEPSSQPAREFAEKKSSDFSRHPGRSVGTSTCPRAGTYYDPNRRRRTQSTPANLRHVSIDELVAKVQDLENVVAQQDAMIQHYESEPYRQEVLSIRRHLQLNEKQEPWWIAQQFTEVNRRVEDISGRLCDILRSLPHIYNPTTHDLIAAITTSQIKLRRHSVRPDEYIDFGCRALINQLLMDEVFNAREFHPSLGSSSSSVGNKLFRDTYKKIREREPQVIGGYWRASSIRSLGNNGKNYVAIAKRFRQKVLFPFCCRVYDLGSSPQVLDSITSALLELLGLASRWKLLTDSSVVMYDFHPQLLAPGAEFAIHDVELEGANGSTSHSNTVLLTSRLGLASSRALGESHGIERATQLKIGILTNEYFATKG